ncbi:MAG TPA: sugar-binding transcriptional regulator [Bacillota bacterium]
MPETDDLLLMLKVAEAYYQFHQTQQTIAADLGVSRSTVSRLLSRAVEEGIVQIQIRNPFTKAEEFAAKLKTALGLQEAIVVPTNVDQPDLVAKRIGAAAARYLVDHLAPGSVLGVGRGRTVYETVQALPVRLDLRLKVVPLTGGVGPRDKHFQVNELARHTAERLGGECRYLYAPALVQSGEAKRTLLGDPQIKRTAALWDSLDWAVVGIGAISDGYPSYNRVLRSLTDAGRHLSVVGDLCLWLLEGDGTIFLSDRTDSLVAISPDQLHRAPNVLAVAGGITKVDVMIAACKTGIPKILVTDEPTARAIVAKVGA